jgi:hypothetical protein
MRIAFLQAGDPEDGAAHIDVMRTLAATVTALQANMMDPEARVADLEDA